jgi:tetratricopeptide (TPR) repeat protein
VSEEKEGPESGPEGIGAGTDPTATALALAGAGREEANAFLKKQGALIDDQRHHMHEQFKQVRLAILGQRLSLALKIGLAGAGLAVLAGLALAVWNASQASGLVVDGFAVPPQLAASGTTGEVIAEDLNEKLSLIRDTSDARSLTRSSLVSATRDDDIKVEIPETGASVGEMWRVLRRWFGHERHLNGNVRVLGDGKLALTVSMNGANAATFTGTSGELDRLEQQAAEHAYAQEDPVNYTIYLALMKRYSEVLPNAEHAAKQTGSPIEKANGASFWASQTLFITGDAALAYQRARLSAAIDPNNMPSYVQMANAAMLLGHDEEVLQLRRVIPTLKEKDQARGLVGRGVARLLFLSSFREAAALGDFLHATAMPGESGNQNVDMSRAEYAALAHDSRDARRRIATLIIAAGSDAPRLTQASAGSEAAAAMNQLHYVLHAVEENWQAAAADARTYAAMLETGPDGGKIVGTASRTQAAPLLAIALAHRGDFAGAHQALLASPADCYPCLRAQGQVSALEKNAADADRWFARAVAAAPSIPMAYSEWGEALLARGKPDGAIAQFTLANQKGPHFADPLEMWGEALMAKNQSHLALAKFAEAEKYAPNWGRLHLKWGEALGYAGKVDEAKKQFSRATQLDLSAADKAELGRQSPHA